MIFATEIGKSTVEYHMPHDSAGDLWINLFRAWRCEACLFCGPGIRSPSPNRDSQREPL